MAGATCTSAVGKYYKNGLLKLGEIMVFSDWANTSRVSVPATTLWHQGEDLVMGNVWLNPTGQWETGNGTSMVTMVLAWPTDICSDIQASLCPQCQGHLRTFFKAARFCLHC